MKIFVRYKNYFKENGLIKTIKKIIFKPLRFLNKKIAYLKFKESRKKIFSHETLKDKFSYIYSSRYWPSKESVSGPGSEMENTRNIRKEIIKLIKEYEIKNFLDIPCGDFNWMQNIVEKHISYTGGDIVEDLINSNKKKFFQQNLKFIVINLLDDDLPSADLMLCRDCLIHLSNNNIKKFFKNFKRSNIKYLLVTSYESYNKTKNSNNDEIDDGDFRPTFLMEKPFNLPEPILKILDKDIEHDNNSKLKCYLYLYSKNQLN